MTQPGRTEDRRPLGWLLAAVGMVAVSTDSLWVRLSEAPPAEVAFWVAVCSLVVYWTYARRLDPGSPMQSLRYYPVPLLGVGLLAAVSQISFITAIGETRVANAVAIVSASPLLAALCAWVFLGERISRRVEIAIAITMAGIAVIVSSSLGTPTLRGDLLALLAVAAFAANMTMWRRFSDMSRRAGLSVSALVVIGATSFFVSPFSLDARAYLSIGAMGLCFNPLGRLAHTNAPRFAPVSEVALFTPIETVTGTIWAALFLSELPRPTAVVGAVVVVGGVFYGTLASRVRVSSPAR